MLNYSLKSVYFLGIGGVSMSALAILMKERGFSVGGYDEKSGVETSLLEQAEIFVDHEINEENIINADLIVFSSAIKEDNILMKIAKKHKKKMMSRGQLLGEISQEYENVIAVAGSHGKTTTTAMIEEILECAGFEPTFHLGGERICDGKNYRIGEKEYFVTEACEYCDNFLFLHPTLAVVTNVEKEHMDYFKTFSNQLKSFSKFKNQSKKVIDKIKGVTARNVRHDSNGELMFSLYEKSNKIMDLHLHICEDVNTQNCIYAYLATRELGIADWIIKMGLERFKGVHTRFERKKCDSFDTVICDYAHHPTEIQRALSTATKIFKQRKLVTIFQPHTFSRTKSLLADFVSVFKDVENPVFYKTYSAREKESEGLSGLQLTEIIKQTNNNARYFDTFDELEEFLSSLSRDDVLLFLGAGDLPSILHKKNFLE